MEEVEEGDGFQIGDVDHSVVGIAKPGTIDGARAQGQDAVEEEGETVEEFFKNAFHIVTSELSKRPEFVNLMFIELVEFKGKHGAMLLKEIGPKILRVFEKVIKYRKSLRVTSPALLMRTFIGMEISYLITEMVISNSVISKLMPKNVEEAYVDIYLHGILKESK